MLSNFTDEVRVGTLLFKVRPLYEFPVVEVEPSN